MTRKKIAIQGYEGSFHHKAADHYFGTNIDIITCDTFIELAETVVQSKDQIFGIMAIENSTVGSIIQNYNILQAYNLHISGEIYLKIEQNLVALAGTELNEIDEIHSHPMALLQCSKFIRSLSHVKTVESFDTALSARDIAHNRIKKRGAICSSFASVLHGLDIIRNGIENNKRNYTRFIIVEKGNFLEPDSFNKASLYLKLGHKPGKLSKALDIIACEKINLSKLQSYPDTRDTEWQYFFHLDLEFKSPEQFMNAKNKLKKTLKNSKY